MTEIYDCFSLKLRKIGIFDEGGCYGKFYLNNLIVSSSRNKAC